MAKKKTKFPLTLKNDVEVRTLDELHEHFDLEKIIGYFQDGRLLTWLNAHYYEDEANQVENLDSFDGNIGAELCRIFGVEIEESDLSNLDMESIKVRNERIARLKQYPDGITAIDHVDCVAFNQEELNNLLDNGVSEIYLCNGKFTIPIKQKNKKYIGIGKVEVVVDSQKPVDFGSLGISFKNVQLDEKYKEFQKHEIEENFDQKSKEAERIKTAEDTELKYRYFMASVNKGWGMLDSIFGSNTYSRLCSLTGSTITFEHHITDIGSIKNIRGIILSTKSPEKGVYKITGKLNKSILLKKQDVMKVRLQNGEILSFKVTKLISDEEASTRKDCQDS